MNTYANGSGEWTEHNGFRVEVYHSGAWVVYSIDDRRISMASADSERALDLHHAKEEARLAYNTLRRMRIETDNTAPF